MTSTDLELAYIRLNDAGMTPAMLERIGKDPYLAHRIVQLAKEHVDNADNLRNAYSADTRPLLFNGTLYQWEEVMEWRIAGLAEFTHHCRRTLTMQGITKLRVLASLSMAQLDALQDIGPKSITNITSVLRSMGLSLLRKTLAQGIEVRIGAFPYDWVHTVSRELLLEFDIRNLTTPRGWLVHHYLLQPPVSKLKDLANTNSSHWEEAFMTQIMADNRHDDSSGLLMPSTTDTIAWLSKLQEEFLEFL